MNRYLVFGLGMMGEAICADLLKFDTSARVQALEISASRIELVNTKFENYNDRFVAHNLSITDDENQVKKLLDHTDVAFGAIDYSHNLLLTKLCLETKTHFLDLGGNPDVVAEQYSLAQQAKLSETTIIPDCGLAPGMVNIVASSLIQEFDKVDECHLRVGGLPQQPEGLLKYQQVFSIRGLTNEYIEDAVVIREGELTTVPSLTELESIHFPEPFGVLEAFQTSGGTSSLPRLYAGSITELTYKTIRYPGHMQYFRFLVDFDLLSEEPINGISPRKLIEQKLVQYLPKHKPDVVLARVFVLGSSESGDEAITMELIDYETDGYSAMARTTAYPISIIGQMIANGIITERGVVPGEKVVPADQFLADLKRRDIHFNRSVETMY